MALAAEWRRRLILGLSGAGTVDVVVTVDGKQSNPVQILVQRVQRCTFSDAIQRCNSAMQP
jgi:hypothetical protein